MNQLCSLWRAATFTARNISQVDSIAGLREAQVWLPGLQQLSSRQAHSSTPLFAPEPFVTLNTLRDNPGATYQGKRVGRGIGSGKGKTAGRGHKGQKARTGRKPKAGFEGGQTPLRLRVPKRGFHNPRSIVWTPLNLERLKEWILSKRLDPQSLITMKELRDSNVVGKHVRHGIKLLATGADDFDIPVHIQVSQCSAAARAAVAKAGGSVTTVYYNKLGLRALLMPDWFANKGRLLPRPARPPLKLVNRFDVRGSLPPVEASQ